MNERYDEEKFLGYLEGDLSREEMIEFEKQAADDPRLRNLIAQLVLDRHRLRNLPDEAPPADLMDRVNQRLERNMLLGVAPSDPGFIASEQRFRINRLAGYIGVAALLAIGTLLILRTLSNDGLDRLAESPGPIASNVKRPSDAAARRQMQPAAKEAQEEVPAGKQAKSNESADRRRDAADGFATVDGKATADANAEVDIAADADKPLALGKSSGGGLGTRGLAAPGSAAAKNQSEPEFKVAERSDAAQRFFKDAQPAASPLAPPATAPTAEEKSVGNEAAPRIAAALGDRLKQPTDRSGSYTGRYEREDVPVPAVAANGPVLDRTPLRLEISSASVEETNKSIAIWSAQQNVRMEMTSRSEVKVGGAELDSGRKLDSVEDKKKEQAPATEVVLLLPKKQLAGLMTYLNSQKGQRASLTIEQPRAGYVSGGLTREPAVTRVGSATQPATQPAGQAAHQAGPPAVEGLTTGAATQPAPISAPATTGGARSAITPDALEEMSDDVLIRLPVEVREDLEPTRADR